MSSPADNNTPAPVQIDSGTKKTALYVISGIITAVIIAGLLLPSQKDFVVLMVKTLLASIQVIAK